MIRIVIADDHEVVRHGVHAVLAVQPDWEVVGDAEDSARALALVETHRPDLLITDLSMPGLSGNELTARVSAMGHTRVIVFSMHASAEHVLRALKAGAMGYVVKASGVMDLVEAVRSVAAGRRYVSPSVSCVLVDASLRPRQAAADPYDELTAREREVLVLLAQGLTAAAMGERLFISPRTVEHHRAAILRKLGLRQHSDAIKYAIRRGLIDIDN